MSDLAKDAQIIASDKVLLCASKLLNYLWTTAWQHASGTLEGNADDLHDMRVAVRRLRSALQNFEGDKSHFIVAPHLSREFKDWLRKLGKLGDDLGAVRDYDVLGDYLKTYADEILKVEIEGDSGLAQLKKHFSQQRAVAFEKLVKRLNKSARPQGLQENFARYALGLPAASGADMPLKSALETILPQRRAEVMLHAPSLENSQDTTGQHELRKALKRLRYTLEFFAPCLPRSPQKTIKQITKMQDTLGEMQDRTVLHENMEQAFGNLKNWPHDIQKFNEFGDARRAELLLKAQKQWQLLSDSWA